MAASISAHDTAVSLYSDAGGLVSLLQRGRPYICPMDPDRRAGAAGREPARPRLGATVCSRCTFCNIGRVRSVEGVDLSATHVAAANRAKANLPPALRDHARFGVIDDFSRWPRAAFEAVC